jgi:hypothetical protein
MPVPQPAFVMTDTHVFFCKAGSGPIEEALRTIGKETKLLTASADYRRAIAGLPEDRWFVSFARVAANMQQALNNLKALGNMMPGDEDVRPFLRALAKVDPAIFRRYVDVAGFAGTSDDAGILFAGRVVFPVKEEKNFLDWLRTGARGEKEDK